MTALTSRFKSLLADRQGNFGIITAIVLPVLLGIGGVAMDYTSISQERNRLQDAADSAALAAASALADKGISVDAAKELALSFLRGQMASASHGRSVADDANPNSPFSAPPQILINPLPVNGTGKKYSVEIKVNYTVAVSPFTRVLGIRNADIAASTKTVSQTASMSALSMFLVLDQSGSMAWITGEKDTNQSSCPNYTEANWSKYPKLAATSPCYVPKIAALKAAVATLSFQLKKADPTTKFVRLGGVSYNTAAQTASELAWGTDTTQTYVNALVANGGTASTGAMQVAYNRLTRTSPTSEVAEHEKVNGTSPEKFIVFMTDGDNNNTSDDTKTKAICDDAYKNKITVYTVAFLAPTRGQNLLKYCARTDANYFRADTMADLISAFEAIGENAAKRLTRLTN